MTAATPSIALKRPTTRSRLYGYGSVFAKTLRDYRSGDRTSDSELNQMMRNTAEFLLDDEIEALASYMQGLH